MQISQALKDLESSAKAQAEEFESFIIETHKQSAKEIGESLRSLLKSEIDLIGVNLESSLQEIISTQSKNKRWISALTATTALIIGIVSGWTAQGARQNLETAWSVPKDWRHEQPSEDGTQTHYYIAIPRSKEVFEQNGKYYIPMRTE